MEDLQRLGEGMDMQNNKTIEKNGLILNEDGKIVMGVADSSITSIIIPEGVEVIEEAAFFGSSFSYVSLPSTLKVLEDAFVNCTIRNLLVMVRDLDNLKIYGHQDILSEKRGPFSIKYPNWTKLYVPSDLVEVYKKHPVFGRFEHIAVIGKAERV